MAETTSIARCRLASQGITHPVFDTPGAVVRWMGAMQAQDYAGVLWSVGMRMHGATERAIEQAVADRTIVRTWLLRGTLHLVAAQDIRWLLALLAPRVIAGAAGRRRQLGLDDATVARSRVVLAKALMDAGQLSRSEMLRALEQAGIATTGQRGYHLLARAALDGLICFGVPRGKEQTFALLDEWVAPASKLGRDEALAELAQRYFASHGPATLQDLTRWAGLTKTEAKIGLSAAGNALRAEVHEGVEYWMPASASVSEDDSTVFLLPSFDEYLLGYSDRSAVLDPEHAQLICPGGNGVFRPTIVIEGRVAGTWQRTVTKRAVELEFAPFRQFSEAEWLALRAAAERYGAYLGVPLHWRRQR